MRLELGSPNDENIVERSHTRFQPPPPPSPSRLEKHELMEFRRLAAFIYKRNLKWRKAVGLAKSDKLYKDAMETAAQVQLGGGHQLMQCWFECGRGIGAGQPGDECTALSAV